MAAVRRGFNSFLLSSLPTTHDGIRTAAKGIWRSLEDKINAATHNTGTLRHCKLCLRVSACVAAASLKCLFGSVCVAPHSYISCGAGGSTKSAYAFLTVSRKLAVHAPLVIGIAGGCNQDLREDSLGVAARLAGNHGEIKFGLLACKPLSHMSAS